MTEYLVISPSYNEAESIGEFVEKLKDVVGPGRFIILDDGSVDNTQKILREKGIDFYPLPHRGKGATLREGIDIAIKRGVDFVVFLDSDLQHPPEFIPQFIDKLERGAQLVIGSRWRYLDKMPRDRYLSNRLTTFFVSLLVGQRLYDTQSGFRGYRTEVLKDLSLKTTQYETETELLIKLLKSHKVKKIDYVSIPVIYNAKSKINRFKDTMRFLKMYFSLLWKTC